MERTTGDGLNLPVADDGDTRLRQLGYTPRLERGLTTAGSVILTLSDITPAGSLLIVGIAVVALAGTGSVIAYLAGAGIAVMVALCMAELGALFPIAGGCTASSPECSAPGRRSSRCSATWYKRSFCRRASHWASGRTSTR